MMLNLQPRRRVPAGFFSVLLLVVSAPTASANPNYDATSLNGNLQSQCTNFNASLVFGSSLTVSADCNREDTNQGGVAATLQSTSIDLATEVVWNTDNQTFTWDGTRDDNNDITTKCTAVSGLSYSSTDVTLQLTCNVDSTSGGGSTTADLPLNGNITVNTSGAFERR